MQGIVNNVNELNANLTTVSGKLGTLTDGKWCTASGTTIDCTAEAPAGGISHWNEAGNDINYTAGKVKVGSTSGNAELQIQSEDKNHWGIYHSKDTESLRFWNGYDRITFTSGGNVGIGTVSPIAPLTTLISSSGVDGNYRSAVFGISNTNMGRLELRHGASIGTVANRWSSLQAWSNELINPVPLLLNPSGGNVGIGTTSPSRNLSVIGSAVIGSTATGAGVLLQTLGTSGEITGINHDNNAFNSLQFTTSGTPAMFISTGNKVGIGTTSPAQKLDVNGSIVIPVNNSLYLQSGTDYSIRSDGSNEIFRAGG